MDVNVFCVAPHMRVCVCVHVSMFWFILCFGGCDVGMTANTNGLSICMWIPLALQFAFSDEVRSCHFNQLKQHFWRLWQGLIFFFI